MVTHSEAINLQRKQSSTVAPLDKRDIVLFATTNPGKLSEYQRLFQEYGGINNTVSLNDEDMRSMIMKGYEKLSKDDPSIRIAPYVQRPDGSWKFISPAEDGISAEENARIKLRYVRKFLAASEDPLLKRIKIVVDDSEFNIPETHWHYDEALMTAKEVYRKFPIVAEEDVLQLADRILKHPFPGIQAAPYVEALAREKGIIKPENKADKKAMDDYKKARNDLYYSLINEKLDEVKSENPGRRANSCSTLLYAPVLPDRSVRISGKDSGEHIASFSAIIRGTLLREPRNGAIPTFQSDGIFVPDGQPNGEKKTISESRDLADRTSTRRAVFEQFLAAARAPVIVR